ncbi:MAG: 3'-phosphoesterase [Candidatus Omnitrophota bacterium]|nr:MAG: 3'-phosphoesterase [Candidatus Omnitrophota bacterium]
MEQKLKRYLQKRDFKKTPEPKPEESLEKKEGVIFVVQKHKASHLHYDFRLEREGVLKSWAIPKEPPTSFSIKRLAVEVEDHPLAYANFEGEIPEGLYGAGKVEIWDKGSYLLREWGEKKIVFELKGKRLRGLYCLLKINPKQDSGKQNKNWLFFRIKK